jgi:3-oxosteroid 1-dehydrogenase
VELRHDVIVLGTGAAGLTTALTAATGGAEVGLYEKADTVGGTSAWSGGMVWIPLNPHMAALGIEDRREDAMGYLASLSHGLIDAVMAGVLVDTGPSMVRWLEAHTPVRFAVVEGFPDYHPEQPGAKRGGGRSLETPLFPFVELGAWGARVTVGAQLSGNISMSETSLGRGAPEGVPEKELARRRIADERGGGQSLVGHLLKGCLDLGVEPVTGHRAVELLVEDRRVVGVRLESPQGEVVARASRGVVLATGGFDWDPALVRAFVRGPLTRSAAVPTNTGDGLRMAMRLGADLGTMREAWWVPMIDVDVEGHGRVAWQVNGERTRPHSIMVNRHGRRFVNEAANYNALGNSFHEMDVSSFEYRNQPAWLVFDGHYYERYGLAHHDAATGVPPWLTCAGSLSELAALIGVPADALNATVERWNADAATGDDPDFARGRSVHDRYWGDTARYGDSPRSTIGPLDTPPYYAVEVHSGALGTKGGPRTDGDARVLDVDGVVIEGLYAAGNAMASVMGMTYGGAGGTLGPAMVFGYLAGRHLTGAAAG